MPPNIQGAAAKLALIRFVGMIKMLRVKKLVIPIAGQGTRMMPVTSVLPKALFPVVDTERKVKAVLHLLLEDAARAGIDQVCVVVSPGQEPLIRTYLDAVTQSDRLVLPVSIDFVEQSEPRGFGHAVIQAKGFVCDDPFLLLLGDHVHCASIGLRSCVSQVLDAYENQDGCKAMIGMHDVDEFAVPAMGTAAGLRVKDRLFHCKDFVEKPDAETARERLRTQGLPADKYLAHCGIYAFDAELFDCLKEECLAVGESNREIELAAAQQRLLQRYPESYYLYWIEGKAYDMGNPEGYARTFAAFSGLPAGES